MEAYRNEDIVSTLLRHGFIELFLRMDETLLNEIWSYPGNRDKLYELITDHDAPEEARFLSSEILFLKEKKFPPDNLKNELSQLYASILGQGGSVNANIWGLPGFLNGGTGQHVVALGQTIVKDFSSLLQNTGRVYYEGSRDATQGNAYKYRIKDLAAFFLATVLNIPYTVYKEPESRDEEIEGLKQNLNKEWGRN